MTDEVVTVPPAKDVFEAINRVMFDVEYIQKTKSAGLKYSFANESSIVEAVRPAMVREGIVMFCSGISNLVVREYTSSNGAQMVNTGADYEWVYRHFPSGTDFVTVAHGEASDSSDKSSNKAMTASKKYSMLTTFLLATGDDPDASQFDERKSTSTMAQAAKALPGAKATEIPPEAPKTKLLWPPEVVTALLAVSPKIFENVYDMQNALKLSKFMVPYTTPLKGVMFWSEHYREHRNMEGLKPQEAADLADDDYIAEKTRKAQDKVGE
jgi:hypothetical protein